MLLSRLPGAHTGWRKILQEAQEAGAATLQQTARLFYSARLRGEMAKDTKDEAECRSALRRMFTKG